MDQPAPANRAPTIAMPATATPADGMSTVPRRVSQAISSRVAASTAPIAPLASSASRLCCWETLRSAVIRSS